MSELVGLLLDLRAWAREGARELEEAIPVYDRHGQQAAAGLADCLAHRHYALTALLDGRIDAERARLAAAVAKAEEEARWLGGRFGAKDGALCRAIERYGAHAPMLAALRGRVEELERQAYAAEEAAEAARAALAAFDRLVKVEVVTEEVGR